MVKQTSERVSVEMEKTSRRLTAQIHADKKEIARLKEVNVFSNHAAQFTHLNFSCLVVLYDVIFRVVSHRN